MEVEFVRPSPLAKRAMHIRSQSPNLLMNYDKQFPATFAHPQTANAARMSEQQYAALAATRPQLHRPQSLPLTPHKTAAAMAAHNAARRMTVCAQPNREIYSSAYHLPSMPVDFNCVTQTQSQLCSSSHFQHGFLDCLNCLELRQKKIELLSNSYEQFQLDEIHHQQQQHMQNHAQIEQQNMQSAAFQHAMSAPMSSAAVVYPNTQMYNPMASSMHNQMQGHAQAQLHTPIMSTHYSHLAAYPSTPLSVLPSLEESSTPMPSTPHSLCHLPETPNSSARRNSQPIIWEGAHVHSQRKTSAYDRHSDKHREYLRIQRSTKMQHYRRTSVASAPGAVSSASSSSSIVSKQRTSPIPKLDSAKLQSLLSSFTDPSKVTSLDPNECLSGLLLIGDERMNRMIGEQYQLTALTNCIQRELTGTNTKPAQRKPQPQPVHQTTQSDVPTDRKPNSHTEVEMCVNDNSEHEARQSLPLSDSSTHNAQTKVLNNEKLISKTKKTDKDGAFLAHRQSNQRKRQRRAARSTSSSPATTLSQVETKRRRVDSPASISSSLSCDSPASSPATSAQTTPTLSPARASNPPPGELSFLAQIASLMR